MGGFIEAIQIRDITEASCRNNPKFWHKKLSPYLKEGSSRMDNNYYTQVASYAAKCAMAFATDDMLNEGEELCFMDKARRPFMIFFYKDFRYQTKKNYRPKVKFRGSKAQFSIYVYPSLLRKAGMKKVRFLLERNLYLRLSNRVRHGVDYPVMPDMNVFYQMKKPFHDRN